MLVYGTKGGDRLHFDRLNHRLHGRINHGHREVILFGKALGEFLVGFYNTYHLYASSISPAKNPMDMGMGQSHYADLDRIFGLGCSYVGEHEEKVGENK